MKCPFCGNVEDKVIDSRISNEGGSIRRRRECLKCQKRFTTYERLEEHPLMVIKKDGRREPFDRKKLLSGILKACEKRPVPMEKVEGMVDEVERIIQRNYEKEVSSTAIGEFVMKQLHDLDEVAYVRFASVYRQFKDINQFMKELSSLLKEGQKPEDRGNRF
ncbi:MAG: transcriptional regulator NrdR [Omnitrophica WOR_2 bacterium RIFCSPLOWO2_12_FULL_51_24]|nr:MAG: transcriptional regulator NrdR [Omnitrophica WOR_2 bacterium RIFCSPHIGHO2_01_FULL_49_10]OGX36145.1 MAG: transcriptional regulator NrdR [Omnitrophica WOR_2 bacterium RIFCSPLOWO2_02_FULL_50_19]OGX43360.1 MAG: transcriptional regulator NrdR [Omnitrophica WOR_2 bacterium RIFCSPLOWO2_12_FULL_51_24]